MLPNVTNHAGKVNRTFEQKLRWRNRSDDPADPGGEVEAGLEVHPAMLFIGRTANTIDQPVELWTYDGSLFNIRQLREKE